MSKNPQLRQTKTILYEGGLNVRKIIIISVCFLFYFVIFKGVSGVNAETEFVPQNKRPTIMELAFLRELGPFILKTMDEHGDTQLFTSERIEKIIRNEQNDFYDVTLRVVGFEGPLNPPYKLIRITFRFPGENYTNYSVMKYEHKHITPDEFSKLSKFVDR